MTLKQKFCEPFDGLKKETADKLLKIADDYAIYFLKWFDKNAYSRGENSFLLWDNDKEPLTAKELLEIFKKEEEL